MVKREVVTKFRNGRIHIFAPLKPQQPKERDHSNATTRIQIAGENSSLFAGFGYQAIFGGRAVLPEEKYPDEANGAGTDSEHFRPDHVLDTPDGPIFTELKMISTSAAQPWCYNGQFFHYYHAMLDASDSGERAPQVQYAFCRYGPRKSLKLGRLTEGDLVRVLSKQIRGLTILPSNLLAFLFLHTPFQEVDQSSARTGNIRGYWRPLGKDITALHRAHSISELNAITKKKGYYSMGCLTERDLNLDDLVIERFESPPKLYATATGRLYTVAPFTVTRYVNQDPARWARKAKRHFKKISDALGGDPTPPKREYNLDEEGDVSFDPATF